MNIPVKNLLSFIGTLFAIFCLLAAWYYFNPGKTECITANWCLKSADSPFSLAALQTAGLFLILATAALTLRLCTWLIDKGWFMKFASVLLCLVGVVGIVTLIMVTPSNELTDFTHIIIIGVTLTFIGGYMLYRQF